MRKAFKFYRSYYEVAIELPEKQRLEFLMAIFEKQFFDKEPSLDGLAKLAYISQKHSIDLQVAGYKDKTGEEITPMQGGSVGCSQGGSEGPSLEEKEKEKEKKEKVKKEKVEFVIGILNSATGKKFSSKNQKTKNFIMARMNEGFVVEDFEKVIKNKTKEWLNSDMNKYLRPETLFGAKFESYLNQEYADTTKGFAWL